MNNIFSEQLISLRELALFVFALFLLAAAPAKTITQQAAPQPVKMTVPAEQETEVQLKSA